ncbi:MAG TPA: TonB-dependent receptor [Alphaproteobacteria bacterium]|nr:TonB-dependent receptor [Alphaproteobacteria bacterium]
MTSKNLLWTVSTLVILIGIDAGAQPAAPSGTDTAAAQGGLEEIVVTARRREEKLQTVPIAISAVSGETLTEHTINSAVDLGKIVPALSTAETNRDLEGYSIRGLSNNNASAQGQSPVITPYFAEVPYPVGDGGGPGRFYDLENVQVLKGPQGTLFGRNATGGAVLFQPMKPKDEFGGYVQAQFGNYSDEELQGAINIPIVGDKVMARFAGTQATRDGFTKDVLNGKDLDNRDYWAGRFSLTVRPSDDFENYFVADSLYSHTNGSSEVLAALDPSARLGTVAGLPLLFSGTGPTIAQLTANPAAAIAAARAAGGFSFFPLSEVSHLLAQQNALGPRAIAAGNNPIEKYWSWGLTDIARWDLSESATVRNIFGYREYQQFARYDDDGTILPLIGQVSPGGWNVDQAQYTDELQLQGRSLADSLTWTAGVFGLFGHTAGSSGNVTQQFGSLIYSQVHPTTRSEAIYAQASYDLGHSLDALQGFKLTAGYRFTWDYRSLDLVQKNAAGACSAPGADRNCDVSVSLHGTQPSWDIGLDYQVTSNAMIYVSARRGFRAGGLNSQSLIANQIEFKPETVEDVELGLKADWDVAGMKARTNIEGFHTDYASKQASQSYTAIINGSTVTTNLIVNVGDVTVEGIDADFTLVPSKDLELTAGWAYNHARYDKYVIVATGQTVPGQTYPFVPQNKLTFGARYHLPVPDTLGDVSLAGTWSYQSHQYLGVFPNDPAYTTIGGNYSVFDLSLDWNDILGSSVDGSLFVNNLTDAVYRIGGYPIYSTAGFTAFFYGEPQMYGVRLKYRFGGPSE